MRGRAQGERERIIVLAHQTEMMARQKTLKPLEKYLDSAKSTRKGGSSEVLAMLRRAKAKQDIKVTSGKSDVSLAE